MDKQVKQDINFLEYPLHVIDYQGDTQKFEMKTDRGTFQLIAPSDSRLPSSEDRLILYYFLRALSSGGYENNVVKTTRYQVSKDIWGRRSTPYYEMIRKSLTRYAGLVVKFENVFYKNSRYETLLFHVIDTLKISEGTLEVVFNKEFIEQMKNSNYYRMINYDEIKSLRSNTSIRLYEYLIKQPLPFSISILKLGDKLTFSKNDLFPSTILRRVKPAIAEINKKTSLKIEMKFNQETKVCRFTAMRPNGIVALQTEKENDESFELTDDTSNLSMLDILTSEDYAALEERAKNSLRDAGNFIGNGERSKIMVREEMLKLHTEKEPQIG